MCESQKSSINLGKLFQSAEELDVPEESPIEGELPKWFRGGTVCRVGPGFFDFDDGFTMNHWLDGYAILSSFVINEFRVKFHKKYLKSDCFKRAILNGKPEVTEFGTKAYISGLFSRFLSAIMPEMSDNTSSNIFQLGQDFFVASDGCYFRRIDPNSLESGERYDSNKFGLNGWTAHPLCDSNGDTFNIGFSFFPGLKFYVIKIPRSTGCQSTNESLKKAKIICTISSSYNNALCWAHSFGMTENFIIFIEQPYVASVSSIAMALIKGYSVKEWMEWRNGERNRFHVIEKSSGKLLKTQFLSEQPFFFINLVNCFEHNNEMIVVDVLALDDPGIFDGMYLHKLRNNIVENVSQPTCKRFVLPLKFSKDSCSEGTNAVIDNRFNSQALRHGERSFTLIPEILTEPGCEMPYINKNVFGKSYSYFYASGTLATNTFRHNISKINVSTKKIIAWRGNECLYPSQGIFVPISTADGDEDDGIIISCVTDVKEGHRDFLVFIDAKNMTEIARSTFKSPIPGALKSIFIQ